MSAALPLPVEQDIHLASRVSAPVLVTAKSHEWRYLCARLIHARSACANGPFVTLREGQTADGRYLTRHFDEARHGTLFVDDVASFAVHAQQHLLELLTRNVKPDAPRAATVRVIAGASRYLSSDRATGAFSELLFYRLNVVHVNLIDADGK